MQTFVLSLPDEQFEDVGLNVSDVDRTGVSTSDQTTEIIAGHQQVELQTMNQLQENFFNFQTENFKLRTH